jgi:membrane-associated phospholipid phosphatase
MASKIPGGLRPPATPAEAAHKLPALQEEKETHGRGIIRGAVFGGATLGAFLLFGVMAFLIRGLDPLSFDLPITAAIQAAPLSPVTMSTALPVYDEVLEAISVPGYWPYNVVMLLGVLGVLLALPRVVEALVTAVALGGVVTIVELVKGFFARPRPSLQFNVRIEHPIDGYSFPSGHVAGYVCLFGFLFYLAWSLMKPGGVRSALLSATGMLIALIGVSRIYEGHHWASDVLGGYGLGFGWLGLCIFAYRWWEARHLARLHDLEQQTRRTLAGSMPDAPLPAPASLTDLR